MTDYSNSILPAAARLVIPVQYVVSFYLLMRGHNLPGGGFIGGLVLASALVLRVMVNPARAPKFDLLTLAGIGLMCSLVSAVFPLFFGKEFFTGMWGGSIWLPLVGKTKIGNIVFFDIGVFLVVTGVTAKMLLVLFAQHIGRAKSHPHGS
jgi:multisubunit Na+/H+ antiporter MnhB subunit